MNLDRDYLKSSMHTRVEERRNGKLALFQKFGQCPECQSCHAPVIWTVTTSAKRMPVDFEPSAEGNIALHPGGAGPLAVVLGVAKRFGRKDLRTSHFVTCPDAKTWRRRDRNAA